MANYKPAITDDFSFGGLIRKVRKDTKTIKILTLNYALIATPLSFLDSATNLVYQVPSGKKLIIWGYVLDLATLSRTYTLHSGDTEDAQTTLLNTWTSVGVSNTYSLSLATEILATKFLTFDASATNGAYSVTIYAYEEST